MVSKLKISAGHYSDKGRKSINQDCLGLVIPKDSLLATKGIAVIIADGISSSSVSQDASQAVVKGFLEDYFYTSETWSVKKSATQIIQALNSWLFSQTQKSEFRFERDRGYVCTISAVVIKSNTAHWFHVGDARIYLLRNNKLEKITEDHRHWLNEKESQLSRAMGVYNEIELDYDSFSVMQNDIILLMTDGIYEFVSAEQMIQNIQNVDANLTQVAHDIAQHALNNGSDDNLSIQIVRIDGLPSEDVKDKFQQLTELPFAPILEVRNEFDGYLIIKDIHASSRSHVYLGQAINCDTESRPVVLKTPSIDLRDDGAYLERFLQEEWIARRINNPHVLKPYKQNHQRQFLYTAFEYIEGQTLQQWMIDNPKPSLETVRNIVEQIANGLGAFHRLEMVHQDLRPQNVLIDKAGVVKIIDFGSTKVAGLEEIASPFAAQAILGTAQYSAPEYFLGEAGTAQSDLFSLAVITYQMLTGKLPYGAEAAKATTRVAQNQLRYQTALHDEKDIPAWIDHTLKKALHPSPYKRYQELSEFIYNLRQPSKDFLSKTRPPLVKRNPIAFWQTISLLLILVILYLLSH